MNEEDKLIWNELCRDYRALKKLVRFLDEVLKKTPVVEHKLSGHFILDLLENFGAVLNDIRSEIERDEEEEEEKKKRGGIRRDKEE